MTIVCRMDNLPTRYAKNKLGQSKNQIRTNGLEVGQHPRNHFHFSVTFLRKDASVPKMRRIGSKCQDRALLLLQIAQECPGFREQATHLAREWLSIAAVADRLSGRNGQAEGQRRANLGTSRLWMN